MAHVRAFLLHSILSCYTAAITVIPLSFNLPKPYESDITPITSDSDLLSKLHAGTNLSSQAFFSSHTWENANNITLDTIYASQDSFVRGAIDAGTKHQHLVIQPQDIWLTILKQLSFYLRKHKDDKEVAENWDNLDGKTTEAMAIMWPRGLDTWARTQFNLRSKANWLSDWVRPNFGTVSKNPYSMLANSSEEMLANSLMMASSSPSSEQFTAFPCKNGIPSITLNGTKDDWKLILTKVESLGKFGKEPQLYSNMLRIVLSRFVQTFDTPNELATRLFWNDIVTATPRQDLCITTELITGWINAFHMWDPAGNLAITSAVTTAEAVQLDGMLFPWRHSKDVPISNSHIPMCGVADTARWGSYRILIGMLAKSVKQGKPDGYEAALKLAGLKLPSSVAESDHSMLRPLPIWISHPDNSVSDISNPSHFLWYEMKHKLTKHRRYVAVVLRWRDSANVEVPLRLYCICFTSDRTMSRKFLLLPRPATFASGAAVQDFLSQAN
jgi:hypothetical protein